jgi:opacity protein-like surface antigen
LRRIQPERHQTKKEILVFRTFLVSAVILLFSGLGIAQVPAGNVFFGYSYMSADQATGGRANLNGWNGSLEGKVFPLLGIVADISGHYGSQDFPLVCTGVCTPPNLSSSTHSFLFGPRLSVSVGKFRPFAHALFGASHISGSATGISESDTSFAYALGGGLDYHLVPLISWRIQGDALQTRFFGGTQSNARISTGIVIHF